MTKDEEHLRLLSIFHYVVGGMAALFAMFPTLHLIMGLVLIFFPQNINGQGGPPPVFIGWLFVIFSTVFITIGLIFATCVLMTGRFLAGRRHYMYCFVMACVECVFMPFGTVLGVFTIIVLQRQSAKDLFITDHSVEPAHMPSDSRE